MRVSEANWTFKCDQSGAIGECYNLDSRQSTLMQMELCRLGIEHECQENPYNRGNYTITVKGSAADRIEQLSLQAQAEAYKGR